MCPYIDFGIIKIPAYGLFMCIAVMLCSFLIIKKAKKAGIVMEDVIVLLAVAACSFVLGGKILYLFVTYTPAQMVEYIKAGDFSFIKSGGMVFYGGLIMGIVSVLITAKLSGIKVSTLDECIVPFIPLGHAIGRIGCLFAGCCHGVRYNGIFAVKSRLISETATYFPIQLVEAACNIVIMLILLIFVKKGKYKYNVLTSYLAMYSVMRFCLEYFRGDEVRGVYWNLSTSQWISIALLVMCLVYKFIMTNKAKGM